MRKSAAVLGDFVPVSGRIGRGAHPLIYVNHDPDAIDVLRSEVTGLLNKILQKQGLQNLPI